MLGYGFKVIYPDPDLFAEHGFEKTAHIPAIYDSRPGYARLPSRFLIDRALGTWDPGWRGSRQNPKLPSRISVRNYAYWLCNALEWAEIRGVDLVNADYSTHLVGRYQKEMLEGIWSTDGGGLSAQTINKRVDTALEFTIWCADKGLREQFIVPTISKTLVAGSHKNSRSHEAKTVQSRKGKVKPNKKTLAFPRDEEIKAWRKRVYDQQLVGATEGLMVDHVLNTAIRREELSCWRVDSLPLDPRYWKIVNPDQPGELQMVAIEIQYGTKGTEYLIDEYGDKVGPRDTIHVPLWLCNSIHQYRSKDRLLALKQATKGVRDPAKARRILEQSVHLYINPKTGKRYTGAQIYEFWTKVDRPPHWSPHLARDWWACTTLRERMEQNASLIQQVLNLKIHKEDHPLMRMLKDTIMTVIMTEIQPQLRHASSRTTEIYLEWFFNQVRIPLTLTRLWVEDGDTGEGMD